MPTVDLPGDAIDEDRLGLHGQAEVIGEPGDLAVLHAGVGLELVGRDDRAGVDLHHVPLDRELAALLLELPGAVHELPLVDFLLRLGRVEQRERRLRVGAVALLLGRQLLGVRQRQRRLHRRRRGRLIAGGVGRDEAARSAAAAAPTTAAAREGFGASSARAWRAAFARAGREPRSSSSLAPTTASGRPSCPSPLSSVLSPASRDAS